ncbi:hypothetical protein [Staphylococcus succinus]|uniref:Uncharacterized protein n=1 Tax=Staphylococcus succinus TaxID=61015 RepID=A0ABX5IJ07_9STAP|nr:hypothetical protein [Staphylococcus succinus]PTI65668.1 hypothetical protein BU057_12980 [Staphylococcus succinus]RIN21593.1 hypothetical protein BU067_13550 [Staphylococcus succinus]
MISIISAIGSIGTFIMALFYFVSVSVQLYQMKISFIPALAFNQILLTKDSNQELHLINTTSNVTEHEDYLKLYNLGGGAARKITIEILLGEDKVIQTKYVNMLPSKEGYLIPINKKVFEELDSTIKNNGYESNMNIRLKYSHNVSRKEQEILLKGHIDSFNNYNEKDIYELQFM